MTKNTNEKLTSAIKNNEDLTNIQALLDKKDVDVKSKSLSVNTQSRN